MTETVDRDAIQRAGQVARQEYGADDLNGLCYEVNELLGELLIDEGLPHTRDVYGVRHVRIGPNGEERHYVCAISGEYVEGASDDETIYADAALTQFSHEAAERGRVDAGLAPGRNLPTVAVAAEDDALREVYCAPEDCSGASETPDVLTAAHEEAVGDAVEAALAADSSTFEEFDCSARITLRVRGCSSDGVAVSVSVDESCISSPSPPETPRRADMPLNGIHADLRGAIPDDCVLDWELVRCGATVMYEARVLTTDGSESA